MSHPETIADGLLAQHKLLVSVIHTDWATRLDHKVAAVIIERYMRKQGNSRASLRYLEKATGALRPNIIASTRRLLEHGVFRVVREGVGTRPTEYGLNFQFSSSGIAYDTTTEFSSSGIADDTAGGIAGDTSSASSGIADDTKTYLLSPADKPADIVSSNGVPAPPAPGLTAVAGAGSFEAIWKAYGKLGNKKAARAAFWAIANPDVEMLVERAASWAASAKPGQKRMPLEKWLAEEKYDEADRRIETKPAAKAKPAIKADDFQPRTETLTIIEASISEEDDDDGDKVKYLDMVFRRAEDGSEDLGESFVLECSNFDRQQRHAGSLEKWLDNIGLSVPDNEGDLVGVRFTRTLREKFGNWEYRLLADDVDWGAKPPPPSVPTPVSFAAIAAALPLNYTAGSFAGALAHEDDDDEEEAA